MTLAIIGIVAAVTIPTLMNSANDNKYKSKFLKTYRTLDQVTRMLATENGGTLAYLESDSNSWQQRYEDKLKLMVSHQGGPAITPAGSICWHERFDASYLNGNADEGWSGFNCFILLDGTMISMELDADFDCLGEVHASSTIQRCGYFKIDVNGFTRPNIIGKDIFNAHILKDRLLPFGTDDDLSLYRASGGNCSETAGYGAGRGCAYNVLIGEDY